MIYVRWLGRRRLAIFTIACIILICLVNFQILLQHCSSRVPPDRPPSSSQDSTSSPHDSLYSNPRSRPDGCAAYPEHANVAIVVKTGATEVFNKIPTQLMTFLSCALEDVLIFSDMDQSIGSKRIYDSLDEVVPKAQKGNPDFELYKLQKAYRLEGGDIGSLRDKGSDAWKLDKYKNIHTARKAWHLRPEKSWYFFIDADTYIFWPNFFQWLRRMSPDEKLYVGSRVDVARPPFAHGGSGYLLSREAIKVLVGKDEKEVAERYDVEAVTGCCGDQELARTLQYKGVNVTNVRPIIQGNEARGMTFGTRAWCQPLVTMHHMSPEDTNDMWQFELSRKDPLVCHFPGALLMCLCLLWSSIPYASDLHSTISAAAEADMKRA